MLRTIVTPVIALSLLLAACGAEPEQVPLNVAEENASYGEATRSYLQALVAEQDGLEEAASAYLAALVAQPNAATLRHKAYAYALATGNMETAVRLAKTFSRAEDPGSITWMLLGIDAAKHQQYDQALRYLAWAQQDTPELLHFQVLRSQIQLSQGRPLAQVEKELSTFKTHEFLESRKFYHLARLEQRAGQPEAALKNLLKAQELEPGALFTVRALGEALERHGKQAEAQEVYASFIDKNPDALLLQDITDRLAAGTRLPSVRTRTLEQDMGEVLFGFAMLMWAQQLDIPARQLLQMSLWVDDNPIYHFYAGMMEEQQGRMAAALVHYKQAPLQGPAGVAAQLRSSEVLFREGQQAEGLAQLTALHEMYPDLAVLDRSLAEMYYAQEDYTKAITYYDALLTKLNDSQPAEMVPLYFARGASYERLRQLDKAEADLEAAIKLDPDNPSLLNYLGYMWLDADIKLDKAFAYVSKAALLKPTDGAVVDSLGWAYYKKGEYARALLYLERAAELLPTDATVVEHLGDVHQKLGNPEKARQYWQQAWEFGPVGTFERQRLAKKLGMAEAAK